MPGVRKRGIYNIKAKEPQRKQLRHYSTAAEAVLWKNLKSGQLSGKKFRRQESIGPYIVDFYCPESRLIVELDGAGHFTENGAEYDAKRTEYFREQDFRVIRFENKTVYRDLEYVLETIKANLK